MKAPSDAFSKRLFAVIFLTCLAMLSAEVTVTRLLSYRFFFHFVFLVLSLAHLGIAGGAAWTFASGRRCFGDSYLRCGFLGMAITPVLFLVAYAWAAPAPEEGWRKLNGSSAFPYLFLLSILLVVFYFAAGCVLSALFTEHKERFSQLYAFDLIGASAGCLVALGLMAVFGPVRSLLASSLCVSIAMLLTPGRGQAAQGLRSLNGLATAGAVIPALVLWGQAGTVETRVYVPLASAGDPEQCPDFRWNHLARTDRMHRGHYVIDGDAGTVLDNPEWTSEVEFKVAPEHARVAIIGVGAGPQLKMALRFEPRSVFAVDINPAIVHWDKVDDRDFNENIFNRPEVTVAVDEGRHALRSRDENFDLIVMHAIDTYTASSMGAYSLTENYLYTVEAFKDFYEKLSPEGLMAVRRWLFYPPRENLRLFSTVMEALAQAGVAHPEEHLLVLAPLKDWRNPDLKVMGFLLFSKSPLTEERLKRVDSFVAEHDWDYLYRPGRPLPTAFSELVQSADREAFFDAYPYHVRPCYDSNPFFFQMVRPFSFMSRDNESDAQILYRQSSNVLFTTLGMLAALTVLLLGVPMFRYRRHHGLPRPPLSMTVYFACLGLGFMAVEMASIQTMTLFLGHPTYALTVILLGMLAFAGLGSSLVRAVPAGQGSVVCLVVSGLGVAAGVVLLPFVHALIHAPFAARVAITLAYLALVAIPMGMPMALGIRQIGAGDQPQVAWAWACNGAASVLGTNLCMILMVYYGIPAVFWTAGACYALALLLFARIGSPSATPLKDAAEPSQSTSLSAGLSLGRSGQTRAVELPTAK
jgi:hypothetical protein